MISFSMGKPRADELDPRSDIFAPIIDERSPQQREIDRAITGIGLRWSSLPAPIFKQGWFEVAAGDARARVHGVKVPDGRYRIEGHEWVLEFKDGALVRGERIGAGINPRSYRTIDYTA